jgi:autotransporter-associated beta strand protein
MSTKHYFRAYFIFILFFYLSNSKAQQLAFPGAEGFGRHATGGRTGTVYHVTNLGDAGTGSFRDAVSQPNRIVVFDVAGVIRITSRIVVSANIYIAGQTAPGEGITIYGNGLSFSGADNSICRYLRVRMGAVGTSGADAVALASGSNMIFDHVSVSWGRDETFSINWDGKGTEPTNITIQNSIIAQGLLLHSAGGLIQTNKGVTLYRNLYVDNSTRNNKVKGVNQYVNNIVYNWKNGCYLMGGDSEGQSYVNLVSNFFIKGPEGGGTPISDGNSNFHLYADDNWFDPTCDSIINGYEIPYSEYSGGPDFQTTPYDYPALPTVDATILFNDLLPTVGAFLPYRDYADYYVINEVKSLGKQGVIISNESTLPFGVPSSWTLWTGTKRTDTDNDGIPDDWENAHSLNPNLATDAMAIAVNGYTNIENYINSIDAAWSQDHLRTPVNFAVRSSTQNSITFKWFDYCDKESGYVIQRYINGTFVNIDTTAANENTYTLNGLIPEEKDTFRIYAYNSTLTSDFSNTLIAKSKPVEIPVLDPNTFVPDMVWSAQTNTNWDKAATNWLNGSTPCIFTDSSKVLFEENTSVNRTISITENVPTKAMLVKSDSDYIFQGSGYISGTGSVNKTGKGTLSLLTNNTYTGATVVWGGTLEINKLANGGSPSSLGASQNYSFNLVLKGGKINYSGATVSTDRSIALDETSELSIASSAATVTLTGGITGGGGLIKSGNGILKIYNNSDKTYEGETTISGGMIDLDMQTQLTITDALGASGIVNLAGGSLKTSNGQTASYESYNFTINVPEGKIGGFIPFRNCSINCTVKGSGTLNYTVPYVREYIKGDWSEFSGVLNANGIGADADGSQLMLYNSVGLPNARINLSGNTKIINWETTGTMQLGGLSGSTGTYLGCSSKQSDGTSMTWIVGGAGTNETFNGLINNDCSARGHYGVTHIVKEGNGIWRLNGNNVYSGTTTVRGGILIINGAHTGTGKVTVEEGTLAGKGSLAASLEIKRDAILQPGDSSISTFTVGALTLDTGCIVKMEINKTSALNDKVAVNGTVKFNGTLDLSITGTLAKGNEFTLFSATGTKTGSFSKITPVVPGSGLRWVFSNGVVKIDGTDFAAHQPNPGNEAGNIDTTSVNLSWMAGTGSTSYNIYFGTDQNNLTLVNSNQTLTSCSVSGLKGNTTYFWRVDAINASGTVYGDIWQFDTKTGNSSGISELNKTQLNVYPVPFAKYVNINFSLQEKEDLLVEITDLNGKLIQILARGNYNAGSYNLTWNGLNVNGMQQNNGLYILFVKTSKWQEVKKIICINE